MGSYIRLSYKVLVTYSGRNVHSVSLNSCVMLRICTTNHVLVTWLRILLALKEYEINVVLNFHGDSFDGTLGTNT